LCYSILEWDGENKPTTQWDTLEILRSYGFPVPETAEKAETIQDAIRISLSWEKRRDTLPFEVDGIVIKMNDLGLSNRLGFVGKDPRGSIAYKFPAREMSTCLQDIGVNVGRTGVLTPYAILQPIEIGGVTVSRATLHNFDFIHDRDIRIGDRVMVKRAGDVIPYIIGPIVETRTGSEKKYSPPTYCPSCHEPIRKLEGEVAYFCINSACPAQLVRNVEHFASRSAMDIDGLGIRIVEQFVEADLIKDFASLYEISKEKLLSLEGFAEKKAMNLLDSINSSRERSLSRLIIGLGIRGVGEVTAVDLSHRFGNLDALSKSSREDLQQVQGIGPRLSDAILEWFSKKPNQRLLERLQKLGICPVDTSLIKAISGKKLIGKTFVITGTLKNYSRIQAKELIEENGGKVSDSISKKTDYLIAGEDPGTKMQKAISLGIPILTESEFRKMIGARKESKD
jgi:DNA ligase (NAD+)